MAESPGEVCKVTEQDFLETRFRQMTGSLKLSGVPVCTLTVSGSEGKLEWNLTDIATVRTEGPFFSAKKVAIYGQRGIASNRYTFYWYIEGLKSPEDWVSRIIEARNLANDFVHGLDNGRALALRKLRSREQMSFDEIREAMLSLVPAGVVELPDEKIIDFLELRVNEGVIQGFVDVQRREFMHAGAHRQTTEVIQYSIATSFDFSEGMLRIKCPSCGSPNIQKVKANESKCAHCGSSYVIPTKVLDML